MAERDQTLSISKSRWNNTLKQLGCMWGSTAQEMMANRFEIACWILLLLSRLLKRIRGYQGGSPPPPFESISANHKGGGWTYPIDPDFGPKKLTDRFPLRNRDFGGPKTRFFSACGRPDFPRSWDRQGGGGGWTSWGGVKMFQISWNVPLTSCQFQNLGLTQFSGRPDSISQISVQNENSVFQKI